MEKEENSFGIKPTVSVLDELITESYVKNKRKLKIKLNLRTKGGISVSFRPEVTVKVGRA